MYVFLAECMGNLLREKHCQQKTEKLNKLLKTEHDTEEKQTDKKCEDYEPGT